MSDPTPEQRKTAALVRDEHRTGTCEECCGVGPCWRYSTWFPIIAELPKEPRPWTGDAMTWWP